MSGRHGWIIGQRPVGARLGGKSWFPGIAIGTGHAFLWIINTSPMPVYKYPVSITVKPAEKVVLRVEFPDVGTAAPHDIDMPGPNDLDRFNEFEEELGRGSDFIDDRIIVYSKPVNFDQHNPQIKVNYYINEVLEVEHTNTKSADPTPQIKVTFSFKKKK